MSTNLRDDDSVVVGESVTLETENGTLRIAHVAAIGREGVIVSSLVPPREPIPVRVQSSCVFSEALLAVDCDCAAQLAMSLKIIALEGGHVIYLFEEGRGIGLENKFRAIHLQQTRGLDTAAAFAELGFVPDPRQHVAAAVVIRHLLGVRRVEILTNNPTRVALLLEHGVNVVRRRPLIVSPTLEVEDYLAEKARVLGHLVGNSEQAATDLRENRQNASDPEHRSAD